MQKQGYSRGVKTNAKYAGREEKLRPAFPACNEKVMQEMAMQCSRRAYSKKPAQESQAIGTSRKARRLLSRWKNSLLLPREMLRTKNCRFPQDIALPGLMPQCIRAYRLEDSWPKTQNQPCPQSSKAYIMQVQISPR